jgi:hypothetical protein
MGVINNVHNAKGEISHHKAIVGMKTKHHQGFAESG